MRHRILSAVIVSAVTLVLLAAPSGSVAAADYRAEPLAEGPPGGELAEGIAKLLAPEAVRVIRGTSTNYCDIWLCKELPVQADFKANLELLYPFKPGQLIGAVRFLRRGADFRDQRIDRGVYTLRYGQQPVDGAHVGTSPTRDFLLLIQAERDQSPEPIDDERLNTDSSEAVGTGHPGLLSLQKAAGDSEHGSMRHDDDQDWWILTLRCASKAGDFPIEVVVMGIAEE